MKYLTTIAILAVANITVAFGQVSIQERGMKQQIISLVDQYGQARVAKDTELLKQILTKDMDQLVSTGEWRRGIDQAMEGMLRSSTRQPGSRSLTVEEVRFINEGTAIADARYVIQNQDGSSRKMWSTFVMTEENGQWKITAIRNMLPRE